MVPQYVAILSFVGTILFLVSAQILSRYVSRDFGDFIRNRIEFADSRAEGKFRPLLPIGLGDGELRQRFEWAADAVQAAGATLTPVVGLLILLPLNYVPAVAIIFPFVIVVTLGLLFHVLGMEPGRYESLGFHRLHLSYVTTVGVGLNLIAAVLAWFLSPPTFTGG